jgi:uncharacterized LabA/DUF88 family protein
MVIQPPTAFAPPTEYLFIDGAYLRKVCNDFMNDLFGVDAEIEYAALGPAFGASKIFYYDCLDDASRQDEPEVDYRARVDQQQISFDRINSIPGFHVRLGTISGSKPGRLRQKEVDVQLAVDMLTHAFNHNMAKATLLSGDLDFRPVVMSLIQLGMWVRVASKNSTASKDLYRAADVAREITIDDAYSWNTKLFQDNYVLPRREIRKLLLSSSPQVLKEGSAGDYEVKVFSDAMVVFQFSGMSDLILYRRPDPDLVERYVSALIGPLTWR